MKKTYLWLLASLFVAAFTLTACGSDDDDDKDGDTGAVITGVWKYSEPKTSDAYRVYTLTFGKDNSYTMEEKIMAGDKMHVRFIYKGTYQATETQAFITVSKSYCQNPDDPEPWDTENAPQQFTMNYRIDGNKLYLTSETMDIGGPYIRQ